jgi:hypothetical protein
MAREPLRYNTPIVDSAGHPTEYLTRLWQALLGRDGPVIRPQAVQDPQTNGDLTITADNDTTLTFRYKGSDGVIRTGSITLT